MPIEGHSGKGIFSSRMHVRSFKRASEGMVMGNAPIDVIPRHAIKSSFPACRDAIDSVFEEIKAKADRDPSRPAMATLNGTIQISGGYYAFNTTKEKGRTIYIEPESYRNDLKPYLEELQRARTAEHTPKAKVGDHDYAALKTLMGGRRSYGVERLRTELKEAVLAAAHNKQPMRRDGAYDIELNGVPLAVRACGVDCNIKIAQENREAILDIVRQYDIRHYQDQPRGTTRQRALMVQHEAEQLGAGRA